MNKEIKILVVDDDKDFVQTVAFWLIYKGYTVAVAQDGKSAIEIIENDKPNIVFLDIRMPIMDGIETLRELRKIDRELPVVIITAAYRDEKKFEEAKKMGISGFFPKKGGFVELEKMIDATVRTHKGLK